MILLTVEEIIDLYTKLIRATGGSEGIRDTRLIESAVYNANQTFDGEELYKTIEEKSARLAFSLIQNHAFLDGNKRIGIFVMLMTLRLNHIFIEYSQEELVELGLGIASAVFDYEDILS